ncbi:MAG: bestrophin family ion channel [Planctomycetaceae bacterium]
MPKACEKIQKTPLPFVYVVMIKQLIAVYLLTLPIVLCDRCGWWSPLLMAVVSLGLFGMEEASVEIEDPFRTDDNCLDLNTYTLTTLEIRVNLPVMRRSGLRIRSPPKLTVLRPRRRHFNPSDAVVTDGNESSDRAQTRRSAANASPVTAAAPSTNCRPGSSPADESTAANPSETSVVASSTAPRSPQAFLPKLFHVRSPLRPRATRGRRQELPRQHDGRRSLRLSIRTASCEMSLDPAPAAC